MQALSRYFALIFQKTGLDISNKSFHLECQILFARKNKMFLSWVKESYKYQTHYIYNLYYLLKITVDQFLTEFVSEQYFCIILGCFDVFFKVHLQRCVNK